jgi:hypothetical protein
MTAMTWYHLRTPAARQGRRFIVAYTVAMFVVTFATYLSSAVVLEATLIEIPETSNLQICSPWSVTYLVVSTVQFLLSDALLVTNLNLRPSTCLLTSITRCIGHTFCLGVKKRS